jgi:hypothetical protein
LEAGADSDLDLFIVIKTYVNERAGEREVLFRLKETEQIRLKNEIIVAAAESGIAEFDAGGKYLDTHSFDYFTRYLGSPQDDYLNTFTGRMLLLLESKVLLGEKSYSQLLKDVIDAYFKDYPGNESGFVPAFLFNDILRMWRTFCVNYEFFRKKGGGDWRIKNLKLKYIRIVTCFSAVVYLLSKYTLDRTVTPEIVAQASSLTPTERLERISQRDEFGKLENFEAVASLIAEVLDDYAAFLELNHSDKVEAIKNFEAHEEDWRKRSYRFGAKFAKIMALLAGSEGLENSLYRVVTV